MIDYPRLVYKSAAQYVVAKDDANFNSLLTDGWYATVPEALAGGQVEKAAQIPPKLAKGKMKND